jgi:ABC transporter substrate binding protein
MSFTFVVGSILPVFAASPFPFCSSFHQCVANRPNSLLRRSGQSQIPPHISALLDSRQAQQPGKVPRVGYLSMLSQSDSTFRPLRTAFREGLREHGCIEDQTITIEWRFAEGTRERLPDLAAELVRLKVDLIFAETTPAVRAAKQATTTIPIVFNPLADPVGEGFVANLARPGGTSRG